MPSNIDKLTKSFINHIDSLLTSLQLTMVMIQKVHNSSVDEFNEFEENHIMYDEDDKKKILIEVDQFNQFKKLDKKLARTGIAQKVVPRSFLVSLVSQFDAFMGNLVKELFNARPEILSDSERKLSFSQLSEFPDIDEAREYIIDKEIDTLLRKSHSEQIDWISNKFEIKIEPKSELWANFIEVTERRNLFVHSDGNITTQYLSVCREHKVNIDSDLEIGKQLLVSPEYFSKAYYAIFELGFKLSQVLWRKILPSEIKKADTQIIEVSFDLLQEKKYDLAFEICHFGTEILKNIKSEQDRRFMAINKSLALKYNGKPEESKELINKFDWSGWKNELLLAVAVVNDNFEKSYQLMQEVGAESEIITKNSYRHWPLFKEIRKEDKYKETFEIIFDDSFQKLSKEEMETELEQE